jgi:hypothetical protein
MAAVLARTSATTALLRTQTRVFTAVAAAARPAVDRFASPSIAARLQTPTPTASMSMWLPIGHHSSGAEAVRVPGFFKLAVPQTHAANLAKPVKPSTVDLYGEAFSCSAF